MLMDRAFDYESKGREFESLRARHSCLSPFYLSEMRLPAVFRQCPKTLRADAKHIWLIFIKTMLKLLS